MRRVRGVRLSVPLLLALYLTSCGYHVEGHRPSLSGETLSVPYIQGDEEGKLTAEIMRQLASAGIFQPVDTGGNFILHAKILEDTDSRIGFRYDREVATDKLLSNLIGVENRRSLAVAVTLIRASTEEVVCGPETLRVFATYDYVNSDSIRDLTFTNSRGEREKVIRFSLGQLDTVEGAHDSASSPLFRELAYKIADLLASSDVCNEQ